MKILLRQFKIDPWKGCQKLIKEKLLSYNGSETVQLMKEKYEKEREITPFFTNIPFLVLAPKIV